MAKQTIKMTAQPKKNSVKFVAEGENLPFDNIYVKNSFFPDGIPDSVNVTVESIDGKKKKKAADDE